MKRGGIDLWFLNNESVQSWFFRLALLSGQQQFEKVVGTNGEWHSTPTLTDGCSLDWESIPDKELLSFLRKSGIANQEAGMFDNPTLYVNDMLIATSTMYGRPSRKGAIPVRFCIECIKTSLKINGFGYFKADWLSATKCAVHNVNLEEITSGNRKSAVLSIKQVLSGRGTPESQTCTQLDENGHKYSDLTDQPSYHVMPCLLNKFYNWASRKCRKSELRHEYLSFFDPYGVKKYISDERLVRQFFYFKENYSEEFKAFWEQSAEIKEYRFGFREKLSLAETLAKSRGENCSKCFQWSDTDYCPIKPVKISYLSEEYYVSFDENPCDLLLWRKKHKITFNACHLMERETKNYDLQDGSY
ncbi:TPA: hypothetical protein RUZ94_003222 [Vibrio cholerae]|nr:hypothetical protein [Vibrio cholerae]